MADLSITAANVVAGAGAEKERGIFGAAVTAGQVVQLDPTTNKLGLSDSNSATASVRKVRGIALNGGALNQPGEIIKGGPVTIGATLTPGAAYYLSDTPGGICPFADVGSGEYYVKVGVALSASVLDVDIVETGAVVA